MTKHRLAPTADTMAGIWDYFSPTGDGSVSYMDFSSRLLPRGAGVDELRQLMSPIPSTLYGAQLSASVEGALVAAILQKAKLGAELKRAQRAIGEGEALEAAQRELDPKKVGHVPLTALHNFMAAHEQWLGYSDLKAIFDKFASPTHPGELSVNRFLDGLTEAWTLSAGKEHAFDEMTLGAPKKASLGMSPAKIPASARKKMGGRTKTEAVTARKESVESRNASGRASISGRHGSTLSAEEEAAIAACAAATGSACSQARPTEALPGYGHGGSGSGASGGATPRTYASRVARATFTNKGPRDAGVGRPDGRHGDALPRRRRQHRRPRLPGALARARAVDAAAGGAAVGGEAYPQMPTVGEAAAPKPAAAPAPALISGAHGDATPRTAARRDRVGRARAAPSTVRRTWRPPSGATTRRGGRGLLGRRPRLLGRDGRVHRDVVEARDAAPRVVGDARRLPDAARARRRRLQPDAGRERGGQRRPDAAARRPQRVGPGHGRVKWVGRRGTSDRRETN